MRVYEENGMRIAEDDTPEGFVIVNEYTPCHTITPWDSYGMRHQNEYARVLAAAGIPSVPLLGRHTIIHPRGTGQNGAVRFGDDMCPSTYRLAVRAEDESAAHAAIVAHRAAIAEWLLDPSQPLPAACRE